MWWQRSYEKPQTLRKTEVGRMAKLAWMWSNSKRSSHRSPPFNLVKLSSVVALQSPCPSNGKSSTQDISISKHKTGQECWQIANQTFRSHLALCQLLGGGLAPRETLASDMVKETERNAEEEENVIAPRQVSLFRFLLRQNMWLDTFSFSCLNNKEPSD